ncbi:MAG: polysaccharide deacetylase family protein [Clostridia bacterium]
MKKSIALLVVIFSVLSLTLLAYGDKEKIVYITFDDGPTPNTPVILDTLAKYNAKATFFVLDERITMYPEYLSRMNAEGHSIGLHGVSHDVNTIYKSPSEPLSEMNSERETLYNTLGIKTNLIRTPYGSYPYMSYEQYKILKAANYKIWDWTIDPRDSVGTAPTAQSMISRIKNDLKGNECPIVLLHDRKSTAKNLDTILSYFASNGYSFGVIDENMDPVNFMELYGPAKEK